MVMIVNLLRANCYIIPPNIMGRSATLFRRPGVAFFRELPKVVSQKLLAAVTLRTECKSSKISLFCLKLNEISVNKTSFQSFN